MSIPNKIQNKVKIEAAKYFQIIRICDSVHAVGAGPRACPSGRFIKRATTGGCPYKMFFGSYDIKVKSLLVAQAAFGGETSEAALPAGGKAAILSRRAYQDLFAHDAFPTYTTSSVL
jgi:hypothetical protein